jgi:hypothetical protein
MLMYLDLKKEHSAEDVLKIFLWQRPHGFTLEEFCNFLDLDDSLKLGDKTFANSAQVKKFCSQQSEEYQRFYSEIKVAALAHGKQAFTAILEQGLLSCPYVGFVDVGYTATALRNIANYLHCESDLNDCLELNVGLYLFAESDGLKQNMDFSGSIPHSRVDNSASKASKQAHSLSVISPKDIPFVLKPNFGWLEVFFKDRHSGALVNYRESNGQLIPVFEDADTTNNRFIFTPLMQADDPGSLDNRMRYFSSTYLRTLKNIFLTRMSNPSIEDSEAIGQFEQAVGGLDEKAQSIVLDTLTILDLYPSRLSNHFKNDVWIVGSLAASGKRYLVAPVKLMVMAKRSYNKVKTVLLSNRAKKVYERVLRRLKIG